MRGNRGRRKIKTNHSKPKNRLENDLESNIISATSFGDFTSHQMQVTITPHLAQQEHLNGGELIRKLVGLPVQSPGPFAAVYPPAALAAKGDILCRVPGEPLFAHSLGYLLRV